MELPASRSRARHAREIAVATAVADSLIANPLLCELLSVMGGVLERNIALDFARDFKSRATANTERFAKLVGARLPALPEQAARHFAAATMVFVAGIWPYANPTPVVARVSEELGMPCGADLFTKGLTDALINQLVGLATRAD